MVRELLDGRFENTAFVIFDPSGTKRLSKTGRSPDQGLSTKRGPGPGKASNEEIVDRMHQIASGFTPIGRVADMQLQDFDSFRQALNVASADQRLLLFVNVDKRSRAKVLSNLKEVFADSEIVGKFHLDFADPKTDAQWGASVKGATNNAGMSLIRSGQFGLDGSVVQQLSLKAKPKDIKSALLSANEKFAMLEERKSYADHVKQGRRQNIYFENVIPYGEDKDGDGEPDTKERQRGGGGKKGGKKG